MTKNISVFLGTSPERYFSKKSPPKTKRSEQIQIIYCYDYHHLCSVTLALIEEIFEAKRTLSTILCNVSIIDENRSQLVKTVARSGFKADTSRDAIINFSDSSRGLAERILSIHLPFVPSILSLDFSSVVNLSRWETVGITNRKFKNKNQGITPIILETGEIFTFLKK